MAQYHAISTACFLIALDNGAINRDRPVEQQRADFDQWIKNNEVRNLPEINAWLTSLSNEDFETVCIGEYDEMKALLAMAPTGTDDFLEAYFEQVC